MSNDNNDENDALILKTLSVEKRKQLLKELGLVSQIPSIISHISDDDVYSIKDVAEFLNYSPMQIRRLCKQGKLNAIQVGPNGKYIIFGQNIKAFMTKYFYREKTRERFFDK